MNITTLAREKISGLLDLVYPPMCGICTEKVSSEPYKTLSVCRGCLAHIRKNPPPYCVTCGRSLAGSTQNVEVCWECSGRNFYYERSWSGFLYEGILKEALLLLKYSGRISISNLFSGLLVQFIRENPEIIKAIDAVAAVPLHRSRLREREFNQSGMMAGDVAEVFNVRDISKCLKRTVNTKPQSSLDKKERFENVKDTFGVTGAELVAGKVILIIDDLFTTGATLNECAKVLKKAGAKKIHCLTLLRGA